MGAGTITLASGTAMTIGDDGHIGAGTVNLDAGTTLTIGAGGNGGSVGAGSINIVAPTSTTLNDNSHLGCGALSITTAALTLNTGSSIGVGGSTSIIAGTIDNNGAVSVHGLEVDNISSSVNNGDVVFSGTGSWTTHGDAMTITAVRDIDLTGLLNGTTFATNGGGSFTAIAGRDILANPAAAATIDTSNSNDDAGNISLIAGATFTINSFNNVTVTGGSATGGNIALGTLAPVSLNSSSTDSYGDGGNVTMMAFADNSGARGTITMLAGSSIATGGEADQVNNTYGSSGNVTIYAGGRPVSGSAVTLDGVNTGSTAALSLGPWDNNSGGGGGNVTIITTQPDATGEVQFSSGSQNGGFGTTNYNVADVTTGDVFAPGSSVTITSGGNVTVHDVNVSGAGGLGALCGSCTGVSGGNGGSINIYADGSINANNLLAFGGGGGGGFENFNNCCNGNGGSGGAGGSITLAGANNSNSGAITITGQVNTSGGGGGGGTGRYDVCCTASQGPGAGGSGGHAGSITLLSS